MKMTRRRLPSLTACAILFVVLGLSGCAGTKPGPDPGITEAKELGVTIVLIPVDPTDPDRAKQFHRDVSRLRDGADHIRWRNQTGALQSIDFRSAGNWPFQEPYKKFQVRNNEWSQWYTMKGVDEIDQNDKFAYEVDPLLTTGPPEEPVVTANP